MPELFFWNKSGVELDHEFSELVETLKNHVADWQKENNYHALIVVKKPVSDDLFIFDISTAEASLDKLFNQK